MWPGKLLWVHIRHIKGPWLTLKQWNQHTWRACRADSGIRASPGAVIALSSRNNLDFSLNVYREYSSRIYSRSKMCCCEFTMRKEPRDSYFKFVPPGQICWLLIITILLQYYYFHLFSVFICLLTNSTFFSSELFSIHIKIIVVAIIPYYIINKWNGEEVRYLMIFQRCQ